MCLFKKINLRNEVLTSAFHPPQKKERKENGGKKKNPETTTTHSCPVLLPRNKDHHCSLSYMNRVVEKPSLENSETEIKSSKFKCQAFYKLAMV